MYPTRKKPESWGIVITYQRRPVTVNRNGIANRRQASITQRAVVAHNIVVYRREGVKAAGVRD